MIDYADAEILDILPANLKSEETESISYAIKGAVERMLDFMSGCSAYAAMDKLPEKVLDLIAVELGTMYYDQAMPVELKRQLITQTYAWYLHAGTPSVMEQFLDTLFDGGTVSEWYSYGGDPFCFGVDVNVNEYAITAEDHAKIKRQLNLCKNVRSWMDWLAYSIHSVFDVEIKAESGMEYYFDFYPRYNLEYLLLDNTWNLDGTYFLSGYKNDAFRDFYPAKMECRSELFLPVTAAEAVGAGNTVDADTDAEASVEGISGSEEGVEQEVLLSLSSDVAPGPESDGGLIVENDLWYLNGEYLLDGEKLLDAVIISYESL